jgi:hypothetical protein
LLVISIDTFEVGITNRTHHDDLPSDQLHARVRSDDPHFAHPVVFLYSEAVMLHLFGHPTLPNPRVARYRDRRKYSEAREASAQFARALFPRYDAHCAG